MQSTLLAQFQALQSSTNMDTYPVETVHMTEETTTSDISNTKIANFTSPSSPLQTATKNLMVTTRHESKYASNDFQTSHQYHTLSQNSHRNDGFYLSQGTTAPSSQGGMTQ